MWWGVCSRGICASCFLLYVSPLCAWRCVRSHRLSAVCVSNVVSPSPSLSLYLLIPFAFLSCARVCMCGQCCCFPLVSFLFFFLVLVPFWAPEVLNALGCDSFLCLYSSVYVALGISCMGVCARVCMCVPTPWCCSSRSYPPPSPSLPRTSPRRRRR